jgi:hypothetical protein
MTASGRKLIRVGATGFCLLALGATLWIWQSPQYTPAAAVLDLRAAAMTRGSRRPVERFLELRYGPLTEPANRQKAFLDFFDLGHMEGMRLIVGHMQGDQKQTNIAATAQWIANYRRTLSPAEIQALRTHLNSDAGRAQLKQATAQYLSRDVTYRSATAPVIVELMTTLAAIQTP